MKDIVAESGTVAGVAQATMSSIVAITSVSVQEIPSFFGYGTRQYQSAGSGSGIIVGENDSELLIATNNHVVSGATTLTVCFAGSDVVGAEEETQAMASSSDGDADVDNAVSAKIKGTDEENDLAVVAVEKSDIPDETMDEIKIAQMGSSDDLVVGEQVVAIGNALGYGQSVTSGWISALNRSISTEDGEASGLIQTDAAINRGNSGGALVNLNGELIGINTAILAPDGGNIGIGFAIPSNMVKNLTSQMVEYGQVKRGELGIMGTELNSDLAKAMKVDAQRGAFVSQVLPNSSAAKAGIKAGDVITSLNGKPISSFAALRAQVGTMPVGSKLTLGLLRDGKQVNVNLELQQSSQNQVDSSTIFNGIEGAEMSNKGKDQGVVVNNVKTGTPAAQIGLKKVM